MEDKQQTIRVGYWKIRGLAQAIRMLLAYKEVPFEDVRYEQGDPPAYSREAWLSVKNTLGLEFPNLPYLIDGDVKLTESNAILRYLGRKYDLYGSNDKDAARIDMLTDIVMGIRNKLMGLVYGGAFESQRQSYAQNIKQQFAPFEKMLQDRQWLAGDNLSYIDFHFYEMVAQHKFVDPTIFSDSPKISEYANRFEALPTIAAYMKEDRFLHHPCNNKVAGDGQL
eukprot:TRINITY_DN14634_c1_g1_i1.p1 TRINITY_DN14634_c1_g1~~TRINITY_DN14634_c1_g1_i1.p1  ORF type:complete len:224 (+),score=43.13 TRINITY_DN14634_c1_g1_i1:67-738(+)